MSEQETIRPETGEDEIDLRELVGGLFAEKWLILGTAAVVLILGAFHLFTTIPIYSGNAVVQVEQKQPSLLSGLEGGLWGESSASRSTAEIEIIRSRSMLGRTVDRLSLDVEARPIYFPLIGEALARRYSGSGPAEPRFGLESFAWGGEEIVLQRLDVPPAYVGKPLTLEARGGGRYTIYDPEGEPLVQGREGEPARARVGGDNPLEIFVARLTAREGTRFRLRKQHRERVISSLQNRISISERGQGTGILEVRLEGSDPERLAEILNTTAQVYIRQNIERLSEEAERTIAFLEEQLPQLKADLEAAESSLNEYRSRLGSIDLPLETQEILHKVAEVERNLSELEIKRAELGERFTDQHPAIISINRTQRQLQEELAQLNDQIRAMPEEVQEAVSLRRDVEVTDTLYLTLLNKAQEMRVVKAGTTGNVRLLDAAYPPLGPTKPQKKLVLALSLVLGLFLGTGLALVRRFLHQGLETPEQLEHATGLPVYASVLHSGAQTELIKRNARGAKEGGGLILADRHPQDLAVESIRSLRTSLQFALLEAKNNLVAITGPAPEVGKSFLSVNLAWLTAEAGKRTLLVDADMRRGKMHKYFNIERTPGLSEVISGAADLEQATRQTGNPNLRFLPAGTVPPNPAELLMSGQFQEIMADISNRYDLVIIDTPPILAVTDAAIVGRQSGVNFVIARAGQHPAQEIEAVLKRLRQNGINPQGFILNDIVQRSGRYQSYYYQYSYKQKN